MAGVKISALPPLPSAALTDLIAEVQPAAGGTTYRATLQQLSTLFATSLVTPQDGGIVYTDANSLEVLAPTAIANQVLMSGSNTAPHWSTPTYPTASGTAGQLIRSDGTNNLYTTLTFPNTIAQNVILFANVANNLGPIAPAASSLLISSGASVPSWANTGIPAFTMGGAINMNSNSITNLPAPSAGGDATNKTYVDNLVQNVHVACLAASTANLTATYANGTAGVGATLTNAGAFAVFSVDGVTPAVGQRILIKNQTSQLENGVYTVTVAGDAVSVNWVLTRATDYDEASEMQAGDKFAVVSGTTQAATEWMMTQTAAITVGVTAITFAEMGQVTQSITSVVTQVFTSNNTYTPTTGMVNCIVEIVGGGGGSGGTTGALGQTGTSAAGGGAGYCRKFYTAANIGANAAVVIGAGGTAGAAGNNTGGTGGSSTFTPSGTGVTLTATGGIGGAGGASTATVQVSGDGGVGGTGTNGDMNITGGIGGAGITVDGVGTQAMAGMGGSSVLGNGSGGPSLAGNVGTIYGGGASGYINVTGANAAGLAGAAGICIVTEFVSISA